MNDQKMGNHVHQWLNAYHDGELRGRKLTRVEDHLAHCPECQQSLAELDALSALLQADPLPQISRSPEQFVSQVGLRLPRRTQGGERSPRRAGNTIRKRWALAPLGIMVTMWFVHSVALVSNLLTLVEWTGINRTVSWLLPAPAPAGSPNALQLASLFALDWGVPFNGNIFISVILPLILGGCYLLWLLLWWMSQDQAEAAATANGSSH